jgi:hypothetical protein
MKRVEVNSHFLINDTTWRDRKGGKNLSGYGVFLTKLEPWTSKIRNERCYPSHCDVRIIINFPDIFKPVMVVERSKACTVFARSEA